MKILVAIIVMFIFSLTAQAVDAQVRDSSQARDAQARDKDQTTRASMADRKDHPPFHTLVDDAHAVYSTIIKGTHGTVPADVLSNARCIAILPNVVTGAFVIGGTHGDGLASCKDSDDNWTHPAAITMTEGSIGLQAGVRTADIVLFFQTSEAAQALKRGDFTLGTDVSVTAGKFDRDAKLGDAGVVAYTHSRGLFAGASVKGSKIGKNQKDLTSYYGRDVNYQALLEGRELAGTENYAQKLTGLFPTS